MTTGPPLPSSKATLFTTCSIKQLSDWLGIGLTNGATMLTAQNCQCYVCAIVSDPQIWISILLPQHVL